VAVDPIGALVPKECACCGAPAAASLLERQSVGDAALIVPYCRVCHRHAAASFTRVFALVLASSLLTLALAAGLPIAFPWLGFTFLLLLVQLGAVLPLTLVLRRPAPPPPHTCRGKAVWWSSRGVVCTNPSWAHRLADLNGAGLASFVGTQRRWSAWMLAGPMLGLGVTPLLDWLHHPLVRVVNLTDQEIVVSTGGRRLAAVTPSSVEHPEAGVETRVPAGRRVLQVHDTKGRMVSEHAVVVRSGRQHLYAPGDHHYCFWIETVGYGRGAAPEPRIEKLDPRRHFWALPPGIDTWFDRNPPQSRDASASGGVLTALRQGRCHEEVTD
jgi:hypothetical protein